VSPIAQAFHDRQPGDAEAAGASAEIEEQRGWAAGDVVLFVAPEHGFQEQTVAVICEILPDGRIVLQALLRHKEVTVAAAQIVRGMP
jgi:hypothetical protein